jgi:hypothetical protein
MKFKYTGQLPIKDADLVLAGIFKPTDVIKKGDVFEVPDTDALLIQRVSCSGVYEEYVEQKKFVKKDKKEEKEEKEDK